MPRADDVEREGHELIARGHTKLAEAARLRASEPANATARPSWIPASDSPLGRRRTLALARAGQIESSKIGRAVFVRTASLAGFLDEHRRASPDTTLEGDDDLFGEHGARPVRRRSAA